MLITRLIFTLGCFALAMVPEGSPPPHAVGLPPSTVAAPRDAGDGKGMIGFVFASNFQEPVPSIPAVPEPDDEARPKKPHKPILPHRKPVPAPVPAPVPVPTPAPCKCGDTCPCKPKPAAALPGSACPVCPACPACKPCDNSTCNLSGIYHVRGIDSTGAVYYGACIVTHEENVIIFNWALRSGSSVGIAVRDKDSLAVTWKANGTMQGGTIFRVHDGGKRLQGSWINIPTDGLPRSETLRFLRKTEDDERKDKTP